MCSSHCALPGCNWSRRKHKKRLLFGVNSPRFAKSEEERRHRRRLTRFLLSTRDFTRGDRILEMIHKGTAAICEAHFDPKDIIRNGLKCRLRRGAVPTLNLPRELLKKAEDISVQQTAEAEVKMKCDSCLKSFSTAGLLFEHIQSSCLKFYKKHPKAWTNILTRIGPKGNEETTTTSTSKQVAQISPNNDSSKKDFPLICKCEARFNKLEHFKDHLKVCTPGKEPPFCIMFRAQETTDGKPLRTLHMTVNDYFYGSLTGKNVKLKKIVRRSNCYSCGKTLRNNVRFMSHVRHKVINVWEKKEKVDAQNICQHCFRQYGSPFLLQGHLENVHASVPAASTCRICELNFASEKTFLFHMKDKHVHNETPYICKVCDYQSSFYNELMQHFRERHGDTSALMCPFCLMVAHNSNTFLKHVLLHIKKGYECQRCRLVFNNVKDRTAHQDNDHLPRIIKSKAKFKNIHKCQVYVRVATFQMTRRQQLMQKFPEKFMNDTNGAVKRLADSNLLEIGCSGPSPRKKFFTAPPVELPAYLCPLKHKQKVQLVSMPKRLKSGATKCMECHQSLELTSEAFVKHFQTVHECRWCVYVTSCEKSAHNHVLKEHADAELREQLVGKTEKPTTSLRAVKNDVEYDSPIDITDDDSPISTPTLSNEPSPSSEKTSTSSIATPSDTPPTAGSTQTKSRRKQSLPTKIAGLTETAESPQKHEQDVQTMSIDAQKGTQVSDKDFPPITNRKPVKEKPEVPAKKQKKPTTTRQRHRKVLAPEGYFPGIDDDEGWAKYFAEIEGTEWNAPKSAPSSISKTALPTMVPITTTKTIIANSLLPTPLNAPKHGNKVSVAPLTGKDRNDAAPLNVTGVSPSISPVLSVSMPTSVQQSTNGPVFRFQVVPTNRTGQLGNPIVKAPQRQLVRQPNPPLNLRCLEITHSSMLLQWDAPANCLITQYKVVFQGSGAPTVQFLPPKQTLVRLVGLKSDTIYVVRVYCIANGALSQSAMTAQSTKKPTRFSGGSKSNDVVLLDDDEPNSMPARSNVTSSTLTSDSISTPTTTVESLLQGLPPILTTVSQAGTDSIPTWPSQTQTATSTARGVKVKDTPGEKDVLKKDLEKVSRINGILAGLDEKIRVKARPVAKAGLDNKAPKKYIAVLRKDIRNSTTAAPMAEASMNKNISNSGNASGKSDPKMFKFHKYIPSGGTRIEPLLLPKSITTTTSPVIVNVSTAKNLSDKISAGEQSSHIDNAKVERQAPKSNTPRPILPKPVDATKLNTNTTLDKLFDTSVAEEPSDKETEVQEPSVSTQNQMDQKSSDTDTVSCDGVVTSSDDDVIMQVDDEHKNDATVPQENTTKKSSETKSLNADATNNDKQSELVESEENLFKSTEVPDSKEKQSKAVENQTLQHNSIDLTALSDDENSSNAVLKNVFVKDLNDLGLVEPVLKLEDCMKDDSVAATANDKTVPVGEKSSVSWSSYKVSTKVSDQTVEMDDGGEIRVTIQSNLNEQQAAKSTNAENGTLVEQVEKPSIPPSAFVVNDDQRQKNLIDTLPGDDIPTLDDIKDIMDDEDSWFS